MTTAGEIMHMGVECISEHQTLGEAARKMRELHIGALPICGDDNRLQGIITDRDIVVRCIAEGRDPHSVTARELAQGTPVWVSEDAPVEEVVGLMSQHKIRRLPVLNEEHELVGIISEADVATHLSEHEVSEFAAAVYGAPPST